jgi:hypothetical protein
MPLNKALLEKTMQHIVDNPDNHNQTVWLTTFDCDTVACLAGWACVLHKPDFDWFNNLNSLNVRREIPEKARLYLGLSDDEAMVLFFSGNTIDDLQRYVKMLLNGEDITI